MSTIRYCAAIVRWPAGWKPAEWQAIPPQVDVVEVVQRSVSFSDVVRWVRRFNHTALSSAERDAWGVILTSTDDCPPAIERPAPVGAPPVRSRFDRTELERPAPRDGRYGLA